MTTVQVEALGEHPPPTGNPFKMYASKEDFKVLSASGMNNSTCQEVKCSPKIIMPSNVSLSIVSTPPGVYVLGTRIENSEVWLVVMLTKYLCDVLSDWDGVIAIGQIVEETPAKVRFVQKKKEGGRVITGDARPVENRDKETDSQPGE